MAEAIGPVSPETRLAQILGDDYDIAQVGPAAAPGSSEKTTFAGSPFDDILSKAISALNSVSASERYADQMVNGYLRGEIELHDAMVAQSKMSIMVQLAVTTINTAVTTFKEITQMQI
jgi:flagellar hook-basal body complex protein FliE